MFCKRIGTTKVLSPAMSPHKGGLTALLITLTKPTKQRCAEKLRHLSLILLESFKKQKIQWKQKWSSKAGNVAACVNLDPWWRGRKSLMFTIKLFPFIWEVLSLRQPQTDIKLNSWEVDLQSGNSSEMKNLGKNGFHEITKNTRVFAKCHPSLSSLNNGT